MKQSSCFENQTNDFYIWPYLKLQVSLWIQMQRQQDNNNNNNEFNAHFVFR